MKCPGETIEKFKDALLSERHEYYKWLHGVKVAQFLKDKQLFRIMNGFFNKKLYL